MTKPHKKMQQRASLGDIAGEIIGAPSLEPEELRNVGPIGRKLLDFGAAPP
jgi:hypothetical protein